MRLFEAVSDVANSLAVFFTNKIGTADEMGQPLELSYEDPELIGFMHSQGLGELNYDALDSLLKDPNNKELKNAVRSWDSQGIKLKTKVGAQDQETNLTRNSSAGKSVDQMAHNVVAKGR
jgi:hypothetical protein